MRDVRASNRKTLLQQLGTGRERVLVLLPPSVPDRAFQGSDEIEKADLRSTYAVGHRAFADCSSLKAVDDEGRHILHVGRGAFARSGVCEVSLKRTPSVSERMFSNCRTLATVTLGAKTTSIEQRAFAGCKSLRWLHLPASLQGIGPMAFSGCSQLRVVDLRHLSQKSIGGVLAAAYGDGHPFAGCPKVKILVDLVVAAESVPHRVSLSLPATPPSERMLAKQMALPAGYDLWGNAPTEVLLGPHNHLYKLLQGIDMETLTLHRQIPRFETFF